MRKLMITVALVLSAFAVSSSTVMADHWSHRGCNSGWGGYGGYSYSEPTYYYTPSYSYYTPSYSHGYSSNYYYPSSGISYSRPGLSISIGSGYGGYHFGVHSHRSSGRSHHRGHRH